MSSKEEINRVAIILMKAWEKAEGSPVNVSYVATFVDMARAILEDQEINSRAGLTRLSKRELELLDP